MKSVICPVLMMILTFLGAAEYDEDAFNRLIRNGAVAKYVYRVVDDEGSPVSNATAHIWFRSYGRPQDEAGWVVQTDTNGLFVAEHRLNEKFSVGIEKEGYYHTHDEINYFGMSAAKRLSIVKDGKWQPYGERRTVVLKRIKNPYAVKVFGENSHRHDIPIFGQWIGFDLEHGDWTPPYGAGRFVDVLLRFKADVRKRRIDYTYVMDVCFTNNPHGGAYLMKEDDCSDLRTEYSADTNASYRSELSFSVECSADRPVKSCYLDQDSYLIFRTRTRVDEKGILVGAHYGKVRGIWRSTQNEMLLNDGCFNPVENDNNIEGDQTLFYKLKNNKR